MNPLKIIFGIALILIFCMLCSICAFTYSIIGGMQINRTETGPNWQSCIYQAKIYSVGESYNDGCNDCICLGNGNSSCTKKKCISSSSSQSNNSSGTKPICWNRAKIIDGTVAWPDGCKGITCSEQMVSLCTAAIIPLSNSEIEKYESWRNIDLDQIPEDCSCYN